MSKNAFFPVKHCKIFRGRIVNIPQSPLLPPFSPPGSNGNLHFRRRINRTGQPPPRKKKPEPESIANCPIRYHPKPVPPHKCGGARLIVPLCLSSGRLPHHLRGPVRNDPKLERGFGCGAKLPYFRHTDRFLRVCFNSDRKKGLSVFFRVFFFERPELRKAGNRRLP